jgi:tRNA nucleotidyltransferase (CCA-adding enzyme)
MLCWKDPSLRDRVMNVCRAIARQGGRGLVVGGGVRDSLLGIPIEDVDIEVYGLSAETLEVLLTSTFPIETVGRSFAVFKVHHWPLSFSLPRRESKQGPGHKAFDVVGDPFMDYREAASRRDFTINAMMEDPLTGERFDFFCGEADLRRRCLRAVSERFMEDPLRVLRGMQFAARFGLTADAGTIALATRMTPEGMAGERVFEEWKKLLIKGRMMSAGLTFLRETGWTRFYPELQALIGCAQEPDWHPEGDVWTHTLHSLDAFARERVGDETEDLIVGLAVLCHDFGKPLTSGAEGGRIRSRGHCIAGAEPTRAFLARLAVPPAIVEAVVPLVVEHLRPRMLYTEQAGDAAIRRLAVRVGRIDRLVRVARADFFGRPPMTETQCPETEWLWERARALEVQDRAPRPIVMGRHLLALGLKPGPEFKRILDRCYRAQLEGEFRDEAGGVHYCQRLLESERAAASGDGAE